MLLHPKNAQWWCNSELTYNFFFVFQKSLVQALGMWLAHSRKTEISLSVFCWLCISKNLVFLIKIIFTTIQNFVLILWNWTIESALIYEKAVIYFCQIIWLFEFSGIFRISIQIILLLELSSHYVLVQSQQEWEKGVKHQKHQNDVNNIFHTSFRVSMLTMNK